MTGRVLKTIYVTVPYHCHQDPSEPLSSDVTLEVSPSTTVAEVIGVVACLKNLPADDMVLKGCHNSARVAMLGDRFEIQPTTSAKWHMRPILYTLTGVGIVPTNTNLLVYYDDLVSNVAHEHLTTACPHITGGKIGYIMKADDQVLNPTGNLFDFLLAHHNVKLTLWAGELISEKCSLPLPP